MQPSKHSPNLKSFSLLKLKSCTKASQLKQAHAALLTHGHGHLPAAAAAALLSSYVSLSLLDSALLLLRALPDPSSFLRNSLLRSLSAHSHFRASLRLYSSLLSPRSPPDHFTFPFALRSSAALSDPRLGRPIHAHSILYACADDDLYVNAALVDMYSKCGHVDTARRVFDRMRQRDLVSWTSMISGYAHNGYAAEALDLFRLMRRSGVEPGRVGLLSALLACAHLGALRKGTCFHGFTVRAGFVRDVKVVTAVVDMYGRCGSLELARAVFDCTEGKDVVCWGAMVACYGYHGLGEEAIGVFERMVEDGVKPNHATFTSLLSSCSHSGLLREGKEYFDSMKLTYGVEPNHNHYACVVDILGRAGKLKEAHDIIKRMPMEPHCSIYGSLLGACRIHGDIDLGERIADKLFELNPHHSGYYVLLSNIYAAKSRWSDVARVRELMVGRMVNKVQGFSLIEFDNRIHKFGMEDRCHPESEEVYSYLQQLTSEMKQLGYVPQAEFALRDVENEN
ncbi:pentatricopeptide repeat-containing protein-like [Iris pallida]|uniref:Pentatricopeptide repeat-containing protein-like n=1 Tax=Iris pallida TaxID=29817 RepID=A0AAX6I1F6_IRIPA|nr:pentatricopeptide repeat-containing protein-like [Iris pallida]